MADNIIKPFIQYFTEHPSSSPFSNSNTHLKKNKNNEILKTMKKDVPQGLGVIIALRQIRRATKVINNLLFLKGL